MATDKKLTATTEAPENRSRRKAVKTIVGGVGALAAYHTLPVNWSKPIIEQVFLPAHAQTSGVLTCDGCSLRDPCTIAIISGNQFSTEIVVRVEGYIDQPIAGLPATITVTPHGGGVAPPPQDTTTNAQGIFSGVFTITGGPGIVSVSAVTRVAGADEPAGCEISTRVESESSSNTQNNQAGDPPAEDPPAEDPPAEDPPPDPPAGVQLTITGVYILNSIIEDSDTYYDFRHSIRLDPLTPTPPRTVYWNATLYRQDGSVLHSQANTTYPANNTYLFPFLKSEVTPGESIRLEITAGDSSLDSVVGSGQTATVPNT